MLLDMGYTHAMNMGGISRLDMPKVKKIDNLLLNTHTNRGA